MPGSFVRSSQEEQVPNPIFSIHRLRHGTLRAPRHSAYQGGLGPWTCLSTRPAATHRQFQWPQSGQECSPVEGLGLIGTVFRALIRPYAQTIRRPLLLAAGSNFGQLRSRVRLRLAWGVSPF